MATTLATVEAREVLRCEHCQLVQFRTSSGQCRRCHKALEIDEPAVQPAPTLHTEGSPGSGEIDVARAVRRLRRDRSMSQRQLAMRMQVPRTYISKIENGKAIPTLSSLERLAKALDAPITALLQDTRFRRAEEVRAIFADAFLTELLPMVARLNAFQQQVLLSQARDLSREAVTGRPMLVRA